MKSKDRLQILWSYVFNRLQILRSYLLTGTFEGPGAAYALWRRSRMREQRFCALYGRMYTVQESRRIIDKQLWYTQTFHRDPSEEELDQMIRDVMTWLHPSGRGPGRANEDSH